MTTPERYRILPASEAYVAGLQAIWDIIARERRYLALLEAPSREDVREFVLSNLACGNPHLLAVADRNPVGWCDIVRLTRPTMNHRGTLSIGLLPSWRQQGIGRQLITQALRLAWDRHFQRIELVVRADNLKAISLYQSSGFAIEGRRRKAFLVDGCYHDLLDMALLKSEWASHGSN